MLWSKARTPMLWTPQWDNLDWNNFKSPAPDPFTSFLVYGNNTVSDLPSSYTHKDCLSHLLFSFWPDYDTCSFERLFIQSSLRSFLLCAISFKDPHNSLIPYLMPLTYFQMPSLLCRCFPGFSDSGDKNWLLQFQLFARFCSAWGSYLDEQRKCLALHNLFFRKICLDLPVNLFASQKGKHRNKMET